MEKGKRIVNVTVNYGNTERSVDVQADTLLGEAIIATACPWSSPVPGGAHV